jgi:hypothetical protein
LLKVGGYAGCVLTPYPVGKRVLSLTTNLARLSEHYSRYGNEPNGVGRRLEHGPGLELRGWKATMCTNQRSEPRKYWHLFAMAVYLSWVYCEAEAHRRDHCFGRVSKCSATSCGEGTESASATTRCPKRSWEGTGPQAQDPSFCSPTVSPQTLPCRPLERWRTSDFVTELRCHE